jgi:CheY-like chemotaxis protein
VNLGSKPSEREVARRIREKEPAIPVIYMTASDADPLGLAWFPNSILVHKRFPAQLVTALSNLLNIGTPLPHKV